MYTTNGTLAGWNFKQAKMAKDGRIIASSINGNQNV
jgi:hypothetical protein